MSQWSNTDNAANSVFYAPAQFGVTANAANRTALYGNVTVNGIVTGKSVGQFAVDNTEVGIDSGGVIQGIVINTGTGYTANAVVTLTAVNGGTSAVANATANSIGKVSALNISTAGSGYKLPPTVSIAAPANTTFNSNSAVTAGLNGGANSVITISSAAFFQANDLVKYECSSTNTAISGLTSGNYYYIQFANSTVLALTETKAGDRITLTKGLTQTGHALQGIQATGAAVVGGGKNTGVAHAGWVLRSVGTGNRAGRVQTEVLVAMGTIGSDGSDDTIYPDT